jgi:hypothetical protein
MILRAPAALPAHLPLSRTGYQEVKLWNIAETRPAHTLRESKLITIDPVNLTVMVVAVQLLSRAYKVLFGQKLRVPAPKSQAQTQAQAKKR